MRIRKFLLASASLLIAALLAVPVFAETPGGLRIEQVLKARGLIAPTPSGKVVGTITPPASAEVDEMVRTDAKSGLEIARITSWNENTESSVLHIELSTLPRNQRQVAFWVFPKGSAGCAMFGCTMYDAGGRALKSAFWRNDPALRIAGAANFPPDLYPDAVPPVAFVRVLGSLHAGAKGELNQQISAYGYVGQNVQVSQAERVTVPAGTFAAFRVTTTPDVSTLMPSWPGFVLHVIGSFVPTSTYYFDSHPPYRMLRQEGTVAAGGPEVSTELLRFYVAGAQAKNDTTGAQDATWAGR